jgi:hypothetical protein
MEVYTISGSPDVQLLGPADSSCPGGRGLKIAGVGARVSGFGLGGYAVFRAFHRGGAIPGLLSLAGAAALWYSGGRLLHAAEKACGAPR